MKIYLIVLLVLMFSCKEKPIKDKIITSENNTMTQDSLKYNNMLLEKSDADKQFGKPIKQEKFQLNELYGEFRGNIYYKYTDNERQNSSIFIEEITWEKDNENYITIWYEIKNKELIPKAYLIWDKQSEF